MKKYGIVNSDIIVLDKDIDITEGYNCIPGPNADYIRVDYINLKLTPGPYYDKTLDSNQLKHPIEDIKKI